MHQSHSFSDPSVPQLCHRFGEESKKWRVREQQEVKEVTGSGITTRGKEETWGSRRNHRC